MPSPEELSQVPKWVHYLLGNEEALANFNEWIEVRKAYYAVMGVEKAEDYASVKGCRFVRGELDAMREMVNWIPQQTALEAEYKEGTQ